MSDRGESPPPLPEGAEDWGSEELAAALRAASDWTLRYRERVGDLPAFPRIEPGETRRRLAPCPPPDPEPFEAVLADMEEIIVPGLTHWNHPGFMAYFASSARGPSVAAELLIAAVGVNAMLWRTSPSATELETLAVDWLRQAAGLPEEFAGLILDTASTSSFTAVLGARQRAAPAIRDAGREAESVPPLTVYLSEHAHSSVEKAVMAAGLGRGGIRRIPGDAEYRMDVEELEAAMADDVARGARPMMVVSTLGTTSTASVDPAREIGEAARRHGAWFHVDAAYAGAAALLEEERPKFAGWETADSIVINPHKWLGTSLDCSVLLYRDAPPLRESLALTPAYLESEHAEVTNLNEIGLPLGRRFRALKLWVLFRCVGTRGLADTLRTHIAWARHAAERLDADPRFELAAPRGFSTVCFRAVVPGADGAAEDALNRAVVERVNRDGEVFISHTELDGRYTPRLSIGSVHTRAEDVVTALRCLGEAVDAESRKMGRT